MSFDIYFCRFERGKAVSADASAAMRILEPLIAGRGDSWTQVETADGDAIVFGIDDPATGLSINHASGRQIWDRLVR